MNNWRRKYGLIMLGVALAILAGTAFSRCGYDPQAEDEAAILAVFATLKQARNSGDYALAYQLMTPRFRDDVDLAEFPEACDQMVIINSPTVYWQEGEVNRARLAPAVWMGGAVLQMERIDGSWRCDGIIGWSYD